MFSLKGSVAIHTKLSRVFTEIDGRHLMFMDKIYGMEVLNLYSSIYLNIQIVTRILENSVTRGNFDGKDSGSRKPIVVFRPQAEILCPGINCRLLSVEL